MRYGGRPVPGFALGSDHIRAALREVVGEIERFTRNLTPRERAVCRICLSATHLEEALVAGDFARAGAHADKIVDLLKETK